LACSSCSVASRSTRERPRRSTDQAITKSISRRATALSRASSPGRSLRPLAPLMPASSNTAPTFQPWRSAAASSSRRWFRADPASKAQCASRVCHIAPCFCLGGVCGTAYSLICLFQPAKSHCAEHGFSWGLGARPSQSFWNRPRVAAPGDGEAQRSPARA
jgi:hypothetical protein